MVEGRIEAKQGKISVDHGSMVTLPCTLPCQVFKLSAKDCTRCMEGIILHGGPRGSSIAYSG